MIIKITPDRERAKMILKRIEEWISYLPHIDTNKFYSIKAENYYEIIRELIGALILLSGSKTVGENAHKELIELLSKDNKFYEEEIRLIDDLRIRRNKFLYEAKRIELIYVENNKNKLESLISKIKKELKERLDKR